MHAMTAARLVVLVLAALLAGGAEPARTPDPLAPLPRVPLWAWERPEDLRFAPELGVGVAALDRTITLRGAAIAVAPRRQPLRLDPSTPMVAVVRVEADGLAALEADPARVAEAIAVAAERPG